MVGATPFTQLPRQMRRPCRSTRAVLSTQDGSWLCRPHARGDGTASPAAWAGCRLELLSCCPAHPVTDSASCPTRPEARWRWCCSEGAEARAPRGAPVSAQAQDPPQHLPIACPPQQPLRFPESRASEASQRNQLSRCYSQLKVKLNGF